MPLDQAGQIRMKLLRFLHDRNGLISEDETILIDSGVIRLEPYLRQLLAQGHIRRDEEARVYRLTETGRDELARLQQADDAAGDGE
ncbi:hypothetical protein DNFV4_03924 [Nitrospira tepida]|uniref:Uncharacterized protein n=2 Tax=Nitrospira tepida TaxID=2973512 RepID=A0AA86N2A9_9BACT|nr:hypothetical protein DNFV4_03924 [Nitrospira tepida]